MDGLRDIYFNVPDPGSFGGVNALYRAAKSRGLNVSLRDVREFLSQQDTYTLHKPARWHFKRNRTIVYGLDEQWQVDLADLQNLSKYNKGFRYLLTCIDIFSKFAFVVAVKDKKGSTMVNAFKSILESGRKPKRIQTDHGTEFLARIVQKFLKQEGIDFFTTKSEMKASVIERYNRTLKTRMFRYFTEKNTLIYINVLKDLVESYNNSYHRSIKCKPIEVTNENSAQIWKNLYGKVNFSPPTAYHFEIGDIVRISKNKRTFEKGYLPIWSEELFRVVERLPRDPPVYKLEDLNTQPISGVFYREEVQKIGKDLKNCKFKIEKILRKRRKADGNFEYFVRWKGYSSAFDSWIQELG